MLKQHSAQSWVVESRVQNVRWLRYGIPLSLHSPNLNTSMIVQSSEAFDLQRESTISNPRD